jgi:hypothetical protein
VAGLANKAAEQPASTLDQILLSPADTKNNASSKRTALLFFVLARVSRGELFQKNPSHVYWESPCVNSLFNISSVK